MRRLSVTTWLIIVNVFVFIFLTIASALLLLKNPSSAQILYELTFLKPSFVTKGYVWTLFTSMFMHGNFSHLLVNMISLFFIGSFVERLIGKRRYLWFYIIAGLVAGLAFVGFAYLGQYVPYGAELFGTIDTFAVGASGAIFGLAGLLAVILPRMKVLVFFVIPMQLWLAMVVLLFGFWALSAFGGFPVGNTAHFGGLIVGLIYGSYLRSKFPNKVKALNKIFR